MKNKILGLLIILSFSSFAGGRFGAYLGGTYNDLNLSNSNDYSKKGKVSFDIAGVFHHDIGDKMAVELQLGFTSHKGEAKWVEQPGVNATSSLNFDYLYLRPLLKYGITSELNILGGFTLGYLTSAKNKVKFNNPSYQNEEISIKNLSKNLRYALNLGVEYKIEVENLTLIPRLSYELSLSDSFHDGGQKLKFNVLSLGLGVLF